jgi:hypothetical protein
MSTYGVLLDLFHFSLIPFVSLAWIVAGGVALLMARHVFSNRSFYGAAACALSSYVAFLLVESLIAFMGFLLEKITFDWINFFHMHVQQAALLLIVMTVLFACTRRVRKFLPDPYLFRT